ncbi:MAG: hypothetical protein IKH27_10310 [Oscillospiraceae bacterium]|nr:hypothetical protein [Oscillospiraceae bacterium]
MKLIFRILTGAAVSACLLCFAGCGNNGGTASPAPAAENQSAAESAAESAVPVKVDPSGTELKLSEMTPSAVRTGDVLTGSVNVTDGKITSAVCGCEIAGQSYAADTEMQYYSVYDSESNCCLYGTNIESEQAALQQLADQWKDYLSKSAEGTATDADIPKSPVQITGIAVPISDALRSTFSEWYGEGFDSDCVTDHVFLAYQK